MELAFSIIKTLFSMAAQAVAIGPDAQLTAGGWITLGVIALIILFVFIKLLATKPTEEEPDDAGESDAIVETASSVPPAAKSPATPVERPLRELDVYPLYLEALTLVERLHRRLLDVIKDDLDRRQRTDIAPVQALLLYNIGDKELTAGELRTRGCYSGSSMSFNLKKLTEAGFLDHQRSRVDRRSVRVKLTEKGQDVREIVRSLYQKHVKTVEQVGGISAEEFSTMNKSLHRLERFWTDQILYGL